MRKMEQGRGWDVLEGHAFYQMLEENMARKATSRKA